MFKEDDDVFYTGVISDNIGGFDKLLIKNHLRLNTIYKICKIHYYYHTDSTWLLFEDEELENWLYPEKCFTHINKDIIKNKYNLI